MSSRRMLHKLTRGQWFSLYSYELASLQGVPVRQGMRLMRLLCFLFLPSCPLLLFMGVGGLKLCGMICLYTVTVLAYALKHIVCVDVYAHTHFISVCNKHMLAAVRCYSNITRSNTKTCQVLSHFKDQTKEGGSTVFDNILLPFKVQFLCCFFQMVMHLCSFHFSGMH